MKKVNTALFSFLILTMPLVGCISNSSSGNVDCGESYSEMYGGYDYSYLTKDIDSANSLNITVQLINGGGGWLEESQQHESDQEIAVSLKVKFSDNSEISIGFQSTTWEVNGDEYDGSYWSELLYYQSPDGFCDSGCDEIMFAAGYQDGVIYYDGTCEESPWISI